jgi:hypothetical protein
MRWREWGRGTELFQAALNLEDEHLRVSLCILDDLCQAFYLGVESLRFVLAAMPRQFVAPPLSRHQP